MCRNNNNCFPIDPTGLVGASSMLCASMVFGECVGWLLLKITLCINNGSEFKDVQCNNPTTILIKVCFSFKVV